MLLAALLTASHLAPARACTPDFARVLWLQPPDGAVDVPADTVLRVLAGEGEGIPDDFELRLLRSGNDVAFDLVRETWTGDSLADSRLLLTLSPTEPMLPGATYALEVTHLAGGAGYGGRTLFTVADREATPVVDLPDVEVISATDSDGAGTEACDWDQVRTFQLQVEPAQADPDGISVVKLYRTKEDRAELRLVDVLPVGADTTPVALELRSERARDWGSCFVAEQVGGSGDIGQASALACAPEPLQPTEDDGGPPGADTGGRPGDGDDGGCGCAGGALSSGPLLALLALVGLRRRR